jgi:hypothetical protein
MISEKIVRLLCFVCHFFMQKVDVLKYTDEEYEKYLTEPVGTGCSKNYGCSVADSLYFFCITNIVLICANLVLSPNTY